MATKIGMKARKKVSIMVDDYAPGGPEKASDVAQRENREVDKEARKPGKEKKGERKAW